MPRAKGGDIKKGGIWEVSFVINEIFRATGLGTLTPLTHWRPSCSSPTPSRCEEFIKLTKIYEIRHQCIGNALRLWRMHDAERAGQRGRQCDHQRGTADAGWWSMIWILIAILICQIQKSGRGDITKNSLDRQSLKHSYLVPKLKSVMQSIQLRGIDPVIPSYQFLQKEKATLFTHPNGLIGENPCSIANQLSENTLSGCLRARVGPSNFDFWGCL